MAFAAAAGLAASRPLIRHKQHSKPRLQLEGWGGGQGPAPLCHGGSGCRLGAVPGLPAPGGRAHPRLSLQNLDDSVFSKRHAKLELDEKRRKRWEQRG